MTRGGLAAAALFAACTHVGSQPPDVPQAGLRADHLETAADPTVRGSHLFPEHWEAARGWGVEPDGGARGIVAGLRLVARADGSMSVAEDRLPATPGSVTALPDRLGGGFLFAIGGHVWRADTWLGPSRPFFTWSLPVAQTLTGLDRVYLRSPQGALVALEPRTGARLGLGPLPASPSIGRFDALDAWRAVAIADLRGVLLTVDAGSTWRPVALPIDPNDVVALGDSIAVGGMDEARQMQWWEVRSDGQTAKLGVGPRATGRIDRRAPGGGAARMPPGPDESAPPGTRVLGPRPLVAALEDGWPLADGTALVARDGALARVRLADGAVQEVALGAFPLKPARCHAIALGFDRVPPKPSGSPSDGQTAPAAPVAAAGGSGSDAGAIGFVCGEPRGRTVVYRWEPSGGRLVEIGRFDTPRTVLGFGNGALAVRGRCSSDAGDELLAPSGAPPGTVAWCVRRPHGPWREVTGLSESRLVVLSNGDVAWVTPPDDGDLATARLVLDGAGLPADLPLTFPPLPAEESRALGLGIWMDGFEERRPGVLGGWIDAAGAMVGIEVTTAGEVRVGEYIREAGAPVASGRWALGWTASRRGFESTDGGMTWTKEIPVPDVIAAGRGLHERACGPLGCIAGGWLRVGWGPSAHPLAAEPLPLEAVPDRAAPSLDLDCAATSGRAPAPPPPKALAPSAPRERPVPLPRPPIHGRRAPSSALYAGSTWGALSELPPLGVWPAPAMAPDSLGLSLEMHGGLDPRLRVPLGRLYAWGPESGDWDTLGRWQVKWQWPWGGWQDVRASAVSASPWSTLDGARRDLGMGPGLPVAWTIVDTDDLDHALALVRHALGTASVEVLALETDRPPQPITRPGGEPFADVEGAARSGGRWYLVTMQSSGEPSASVLWSIEGGAAREVLRVPRAGFESRPAMRLARSPDGHGLGLVVDGQLAGQQGGAPRWVAAVDLEAGTVATPEVLAPIDLADRAVTSCSSDDPGWELDVPYPGGVRLRVGPRWEAVLQSAVARMRISRDRACVERVLGTSDGYGASPPDELTDPSAAPAPRERETARALPVSVFSAKMRYALRCVPR